MTDAERRRILLVEDELLLREVMAAELSDAGYEVVEAGDAAEAFASLTDIDLLFTDIRLPGGVDGWTIAERARETNPDLAVIYATGYSGSTPREVPGSRFFSKPYRTRAVLAAVRELVG